MKAFRPVIRFLPIALAGAFATIGCFNGSSPLTKANPTSPAMANGAHHTGALASAEPTIKLFPLPADPVTRIQAAGVPEVEGAVLADCDSHLHIHLDVYRDGQKVEVPARVGVVEYWGTAAIHTTQTTVADGEFCVVGGDSHAYTLGQLFAVWGVDLSTVSGVYLNGSKVDQPASLIFANHQEIAVVYGEPPATIPSSYHF